MTSKTPRTDEASVGFARILVDYGTPDNPKFETTEIVPASEMAKLETELTDTKARLQIVQEFLRERQCPDHVGKWPRGRCLQCELEASQATLARAEDVMYKLGSRYITYSFDGREKTQALINDFLASLEGKGEK